MQTLSLSLLIISEVMADIMLRKLMWKWVFLKSKHAFCDFPFEPYVISECLRFICCSRMAAVHCWEWKHLYLFSVYARQTQWIGWMLVILTHLLCLQWAHRDTMASARRGRVPRGSSLCLYALGCWSSVTCWHYSVDDSLWFNQTKSENRIVGCWWRALLQ